MVLQFVPGLLLNKQNFKNVASASKCWVVFSKTKFIQNQKSAMLHGLYICKKMAKLLADFFVFAQRCRIDAGMVNKLMLLNKSLVQYSSLNDSLTGCI